MSTHGEHETAHEALRAIVAGTLKCEACGVEYTDYEGPCTEPAQGARWEYGHYWTRMCPGTVSVVGTARRALATQGH